MDHPAFTGTEVGRTGGKGCARSSEQRCLASLDVTLHTLLGGMQKREGSSLCQRFIQGSAGKRVA